jgi:O-antigen/teichoic acid export membrane protein
LSVSKEKVASGFVYSVLGIGSKLGLNILVKLLLAYYLLPEHFGIIGMAVAAAALVEAIKDMGIGAALIQRKSSQLEERHWNSAYWFNFIMAWSSYAIISLVIAPLAVSYFEVPILQLVIMAMSASLLWSPVYFVHRIRLQKELKFKQVFIANFSGHLSGAIAGVTMAFLGGGVWSFVGQHLSAALVTAFAYRLMTKWAPRRQFDRKALGDLLSFGLFDVGIRLLAYAYSHLNIIIIGGFLTPVAVGIFSFARIFTLSLIDPINRLFKRVYYPFFAKIQDDRERIKRYHLAQIKYVTLLVFPLAVGFMIVVDDFLAAFFGTKWAAAAFPIRLMMVFIVLMALGGTPAIVLKSVGKVALTFRLQLVRSVIFKIPLTIVGIYWGGLDGFVLGLAFSQLAILLIDYLAVSKEIDLKVREWFFAITTPLISAGVMGASLVLLDKLKWENSVAHLVFLGVVAGSVYMVAFILAEKAQKKNPFEILKVFFGESS